MNVRLTFRSGLVWLVYTFDRNKIAVRKKAETKKEKKEKGGRRNDGNSSS